MNAISQVLSNLPADFPAAIVVVQHLDPSSRSYMAEILKRRTLLAVKQAEENERINSGTIYIAPPKYHLLVNPDHTLSLSKSKLVPHLIEGKLERSPIRIWSAGCASGEEAYTLAILFAEVLGVESFRQRVKIYATDVDEEALNQARLASYTSQQLEPIPPELRDRFFNYKENAIFFDQTCAVQ